MHIGHFRFVASASAASATFLAVARFIGSPYGVNLYSSATTSFGLLGSGGTCAKAPVLVISATHKAPAIMDKRRIYSSQVIVLQHFPDELWNGADNSRRRDFPKAPGKQRMRRCECPLRVIL